MESGNVARRVEQPLNAPVERGDDFARSWKLALASAPPPHLSRLCLDYPAFRLVWLRFLVNPKRLADPQQNLRRGGTGAVPVERHGLVDAAPVRPKADDFYSSSGALPF